MVTLSESAQKAVAGFIDQDGSLKGKALRIFVQGGGCSGFQYGFTFSEKEEGDEVTNFNQFEVVVDPMSLPYVNGLFSTGVCSRCATCLTSVPIASPVRKTKRPR